MIDVLFTKADSSIAAEWKSRPDRSRFVKQLSEKLGSKRILNVGSGGKRELAKIVAPDVSVFDIDMAGDCDLKLNLDGLEALPFRSGEFDMVCAMDVLEHLENFHQINAELFRVSSKCVLISLPNSAAEFLRVALNKRETGLEAERGYFSKYYGLPLEAPPDRHRWWLYPQDIVRFYENFAARNGCRVSYYLPKGGMLSRAFRLLTSRRLYATYFLPHVAILLEKIDEAL